MYHPLKTVQGFTRLLSDFWLNPHSNNQFYFSSGNSNAARGKILAAPDNMEQPIPLHFALFASGEKIYMTVAGERYKVSLRDVPASASYIKLSPGRTLRLLKRQKT